MKGGYIIKPDAFEFRQQIRTQLIQSGFAIVQVGILLLKKDQVENLYPRLSGEMLQLAIKHLMSGKSEIGVVESESVFEKLLAVGGHSTNPADCEPTSIRFLYGDRKPIMVGDVRYYFNAFHRTKNNAQAKVVLEILRSSQLSINPK